MGKKNKDGESELGRVRALELAMDNLPVGVGIYYADGRPCLLNSVLNEIYGVPENLLELQLSFDQLIEIGAFDDWGQDPKEHFRKVRNAIEAGHSYTAQLKIGDIC